MNDSAAPLAYSIRRGRRSIRPRGSVAVVVIIAELLMLAIFRKRHRSDGASKLVDARAMASTRENAGLIWIVLGAGISTLILSGCAVWTLVTLSAVAAPSAAARLAIEVQGYQFWWRVRYLDANGAVLLTTANEINIPVGEPGRFRLSSGDVIHSFWVPALGGKMDAIPGQTNVTWLQGSQVGRYRGQCGEYCGVQHAHMALFVNVDTAALGRHAASPRKCPRAAGCRGRQDTHEQLWRLPCGARQRSPRCARSDLDSPHDARDDRRRHIAERGMALKRWIAETWKRHAGGWTQRVRV